MKCEETELDLFLDGKLPAEKERMIACHIEECGECRERLRIMVELENLDLPEGDRAKPGHHFRRNPFLAVAAGLLLAVLTGIIIHLNGVHLESEGIGQLASSAPYPLIMLDTRNEDPGPLKRGMLLYRDGNFSAAAEELQKLKGNHEALFFSAISLYMLDRPAEALERLRRIARISDTWREPAEWYQAQALLKLERKDEAVELLSDIAAGDHPYSAQAGEILETLDK